MDTTTFTVSLEISEYNNLTGEGATIEEATKALLVQLQPYLQIEKHDGEKTEVVHEAAASNTLFVDGPFEP